MQEKKVRKIRVKKSNIDNDMASGRIVVSKPKPKYHVKPFIQYRDKQKG